MYCNFIIATKFKLCDKLDHYRILLLIYMFCVMALEVRRFQKNIKLLEEEQGREGRRNEEWEKGKRKRERDLVAEYILRRKKMYTKYYT